MTFKVDESRIRELTQLEADANCTIGSGVYIPLESVSSSAMVSESPDRVDDATVIAEKRAKFPSLEG
jgi:hypothetical protein